MKVYLELESDEALRKEVREIVHGQVIGLIREELKKVVLEVAGGDEKKKLTIERIEALAKTEISSKITSFLDGSRGRPGSRNDLREMVKSIIDLEVKGLKSYIAELIQKEVRGQVYIEMNTLIKSAVKEDVNEEMKKLAGKLLTSE